MTKSEMERTVAELLLEQRRFKRLGTDLPPDKLMLLQRLLYRLGYTKMSRGKPIRYMRLSLSAPRPTMTFGGEKANEHDLHDEQGNTVGNIKIKDRGPMLHVDWMTGHGKYGFSNGMGREAVRSVHDAIAEHYPEARYIRAFRVSGFRGGEPGSGSAVVVPIRRRTKMSRRRLSIKSYRN